MQAAETFADSWKKLQCCMGGMSAKQGDLTPSLAQHLAVEG